MLEISADQFIDCTVEEVYRRVCKEYFAFQPVWDPAILQMKSLSDQPIAVGSEANISRVFRKNTQTGISKVTDLVEGFSITVHNSYPTNGETRYISCHQLNSGGTRLNVKITYALKGIAKMVAPLSTSLVERALAISLRSVKVELEKEVGRGEAS
ncbi:MAG TPA: hypothetical protein VNE42_06825 [Acidimicrobiales bacterium]|nr:hypothetical protein [Acidimicrobiales bacterium]